MKFCIKCGTAIQDYASFCPRCGMKSDNTVQYANTAYNNVYNPYNNVVPERPSAKAGNAFSTLGLVLGIIGFILSFIPFANLFACDLTIPGLIFSIIGKKKLNNIGLSTGKATTGLVLSIIGTVISIFAAIIWGFEIGSSAY